MITSSFITDFLFKGMHKPLKSQKPFYVYLPFQLGFKSGLGCSGHKEVQGVRSSKGLTSSLVDSSGYETVFSDSVKYSVCLMPAGRAGEPKGAPQTSILAAMEAGSWSSGISHVVDFYGLLDCNSQRETAIRMETEAVLLGCG